MENVLEVYAQPYDALHPVICLDESPKQLLEDKRAALQQKDGSWKVDSEYKRHGVAELYMLFEPLTGWREVEVRDKHARLDWAAVVYKLATEYYPDAQQITLVQDNLSAHKPYAFYELLAAEKARDLLRRFNFVYTPKHGSWLNMAEIEIGIMKRQALKKRMPDKQVVQEQIQHWVSQRNSQKLTVNWQFKTKDARTKLKHLYPVIQ